MLTAHVTLLQSRLFSDLQLSQLSAVSELVEVSLVLVSSATVSNSNGNTHHSRTLASRALQNISLQYPFQRLSNPI